MCKIIRASTNSCLHSSNGTFVSGVVNSHLFTFTWQRQCVCFVFVTQWIAPTRLSNCSRRPDSSRLTRVIQPEISQIRRWGRGRGGFWKPPLPFHSSQDEADDTCIYPFCVWVVVFPAMAEALKDVSGKDSQTGDICRVAVKYFLKKAFLRYIILRSELSLNVGVAFSPSLIQTTCVIGFICLIF